MVVVYALLFTAVVIVVGGWYHWSKSDDFRGFTRRD
jgi:hypothetical protein